MNDLAFETDAAATTVEVVAPAAAVVVVVVAAVLERDRDVVFVVVEAGGVACSLRYEHTSSIASATADAAIVLVTTVWPPDENVGATILI